MSVPFGRRPASPGAVLSAARSPAPAASLLELSAPDDDLRLEALRAEAQALRRQTGPSQEARAYVAERKRFLRGYHLAWIALMAAPFVVTYGLHLSGWWTAGGEVASLAAIGLRRRGAMRWAATLEARARGVQA